MSRKNLVPGYRMFDDVSMANSATSSIVNVTNLDYASIHVDWSGGGAPVGEITVEARNGALDDWFELEMGGTIAISGNSGDHQLVFSQLPFSDLRINYVRTSGTGSIRATITSKVSGA